MIKQGGGQVISYLKKLSEFRNQIIYALIICVIFLIGYWFAAREPTLWASLLLCQPVYVILANKYCPKIRWVMMALLTVGFLLWLLQFFRGEAVHPDGLIFLFVIVVMPASLILIAIGLYIWFRETGLAKHPSAMKFLNVTVAVTITAIVIHIASNPLRQSEETIESALLENIPIGTSLEEVRLYFIKDVDVLATERNGIVDLGDNKYWQTGKLDWYTHDAGINENKEDGGLLYRAGLGHYQGFPWVIMVHAVLVFGADQNLKYVEVMKLGDAL